MKIIELNLSHNTGVLKSRLPDAPLEEPTAVAAPERL